MPGPGRGALQVPKCSFESSFLVHVDIVLLAEQEPRPVAPGWEIVGFLGKNHVVGVNFPSPDIAEDQLEAECDSTSATSQDLFVASSLQSPSGSVRNGFCFIRNVL